MGDIHMKLYPEECPKTVENFTTHCRNGYYDNLIFHRVIKGFMIQTGDPLGDGTGGQSIWGREFEDEFHKRYWSFCCCQICIFYLKLSIWYLLSFPFAWTLELPLNHDFAMNSSMRLACLISYGFSICSCWKFAVKPANLYDPYSFSMLVQFPNPTLVIV